MPDRVAAQQVHAAASQQPHHVRREHDRGDHPVQPDPVSQHRDPPAGRRLGDRMVAREAELQVDPVLGQPRQQLTLVDLAADRRVGQ